MVSLFLISSGLRFWGLGRFNTLVFDEVYYAKFANDYLTQTPFFNAHPPLAQYLIAIGIWLGSHLPFGQETVNDLTGSTLSTWSYRWFNALFGSGIPLLVGAIAYQLTRRPSYSLITTFLMILEGLFLVESRYALSNVYIVFFGLLAQLWFLMALPQNPGKRWGFLGLAGICFGATIAVKWNGLGFLLGIDLLLAWAWILRLINKPIFRPVPPIPLASTSEPVPDSVRSQFSPLQQLTTLTPVQCGVSLGILPLITYFLLWLPHLQLNPEPGLWQVQGAIINFHRQLGHGAEVHPYCAAWYTWPLMLRPAAYFYKKLDESTRAILPASADLKKSLLYSVHGMGNPVLWWLSVIALVLLVGTVIIYGWKIYRAKVEGSHALQRSSDSGDFGNRFREFSREHSVNSSGDRGDLERQGLNRQIRSLDLGEFWLLLYIGTNWSANFLPWTQITRCVFLYHYMGALIFAVMALGWWVEKWVSHDQIWFKVMGIILIFMVTIAFIFWLPIYLGLPINPQAWQARMWFQSWI
ncbi:MAG: phospholipid carrier-dependent glycosyltransferase [Oscillatoriales cyanobacterium RM2_1_1]|nr:phospholipid carrier-dependent glycosyltransferase [Oscillatoriales cyanobacterium SM2_3_0]NJO45372.1 phospholipid carrier-dependent glycosyltransferase [Oscillatoriales cyanobacterium RM2_1_1]